MQILQKVQNILKKIWKARRPDEVEEFCLKSFTSLHKNFVWHLNAYLKGQTPRWMTKGRRVLIQKDKSKMKQTTTALLHISP